MPGDQQPSRNRLFWPVLLIGAAIALGWWILRSGPVTAPAEKERAPKIVKTVLPLPADHPVHITAFGEVVPARRVVIEPQVTGNIVRMNPRVMPGGRVTQGDELFVIDPTLTELDVQETTAELDRALADLSDVERRQKEAEALSRERVISDSELASLKAQVERQRAEVQRIRVRLERNQVQRERHIVRAPFNALVLDEAIEIGQRVAPGNETLTLVGTDEFWVRAIVPTDQLQWISFPSSDGPGSAATIVMDTGGGDGTVFHGEVVRLQGDLAESGRMARVLIRVEDPFGLKGNGESRPLLLGSYVRAELDAGVLTNVLEIDRPALREEDRVWVVSADGLLKIRSATVRWRTRDQVYIDPVLKDGEALIISDLRVALPDMEVESQPQETPEASGLVRNDS